MCARREYLGAEALFGVFCAVLRTQVEALARWLAREKACIPFSWFSDSEVGLK